MAGPGDPIPGVGVGLDHDPGGNLATTQTDAKGNYEFKGLAPGKYKLKIGDQPAKSITVGPNGTIKGQVLVTVDPKRK
jgi:protocatechuate 3,4-dioxygenase beta subunit